MKTPMQELIEQLEKEYKKYTKQAQEESSMQILGYAFKIQDCIKHAESLLEKEKGVMCEFADDYQRNCFQKSADDYFKETFNTKEK